MENLRSRKICLSFAGGVTLSAILTRIITIFFRSDPNDLSLASKYPIDLAAVLPEQQEMIGFVFFWVTYAVCFFTIYYLFRKNVSGTIDYIIGVMALALTLIGTYVLLTAEEDSFYINMSGFMSVPGAICSILLFSALIYILKKDRLAKAFDVASVFLILFSGLFCFVRNPMFGTNLFHFNAFFTTVYNVYHGATLGVESSIIYGTYAYLFFPFYKIFGLSLSSYAFLTAFMCVIILFCEFYVMKKLIEHPVIRWMSLSMCIYINVFFAVHAHYNQFITQHFPLRIFFPMVMLAFIVRLSDRGTLLRCRSVLTGILICYLAFMTNLESALTTSLVWASACFYNRMSSQSKQHTILENVKQTVITMGIYAGGVILAFSAWVLTIEMITLMRSGRWLAVSELYSTQLVFSKIGYGMLSLPDYLHIYVFIFLVYALFLGIGIQRMFFEDRRYVFKDQITFGLSVTGILMLIYYMGRTHNRSLFTWLCPCVILLSYILDCVILWIKKIGKKSLRICFCAVGAVIFMLQSVYAVSPVYVVGHSDFFQNYVYRQISNRYDGWVNAEITLLKQYEKNGEVNYIGRNAAAISLAAGLKNNFRGEMASCWFFWDDYEYIKKFLQECDGYIIIDQYAASYILQYIQKDFDKIMNERGFEIIDNSPLSSVYAQKQH